MKQAVNRDDPKHAAATGVGAVDRGGLFRPALSGVPLIPTLLRRLCSALFELHPATTGCGACFHNLSDLETGFHAIQPDITVDVVYTWVDGSDPVHAAKRARYLDKQGDVHRNALDQARFRDNQELRYSLRSLEQFAPWVGRVFVVTDNQCPDWIRRDHPKLRIVHHQEFIPEAYLPTFNSHVIEAYLHAIPGLSEHYLYLNDDVFLGRPCRKTDFFTPNKVPYAFVDWRLRRRFGYWYTKTPHAMSYFNTLRILKEKGISTNPAFITAHGPYAQTKSNAAEAFEFYRATIEGFASNRFRTTQEIAMYCHALPLWAYGKKRLVPCDRRYYYVQTMRVDRVAYYKGIVQSRDDQTPPIFFCINDVGRQDETGLWLKDMLALLKACYPTPSSFEIDAGGS